MDKTNAFDVYPEQLPECPYTCDFVEWDNTNRTLIRCLNTSVREYHLPNNEYFHRVCKNKVVHVCKFHAEWIKDCADTTEASIQRDKNTCLNCTHYIFNKCEIYSRNNNLKQFPFKHTTCKFLHLKDEL